MTTVALEDRDGVAVVTLQRPPANALDPELLADGLGVLQQLTADRPRAVVITGSGAFFSGGADLRVVPELTPEAQGDMARGVNELFASWHSFPTPLVTAVNGHAVAGGLVLALCGDYRIGGPGGQFGLTEVKVGIPFPSAAMAVVQAELSPPVARRLVLLGELFDSATALSYGIFDELVEQEQVVTRAIEVANELATAPPRTYEAVKTRLRAGAAQASRGMFGGSSGAAWMLDEAKEAALRRLD